MSYQPTSVFRIAAAHLWWLVCLLPLAVFAPAYWAEFGMRDDYSMLREAAEEPGKILRFASSQGRPVYGLLLEGTFHVAKGVPSLAVWRTVAMVLVGAVALFLAWTLIRSRRWAPAEAAAFAGFFSLLPCAQVVTGWAVAWPHVLAALGGLGAFALFDAGWNRQGWRRWALLAGAITILLLSIFIYQPNALAFLIPVAAGWLRPVGLDSREERNRWLWRNLGFVGLGLAAAFAITTFWLHAGIVEPAERIAVETDPIGKLRWFLDGPLRQALGLYVLRDFVGRTDPWYTATVLVSVAAITFGLFSAADWRWSRALTRGLGFIVLILAAYSVNLVAAERWPTYRTLWPLTGVILMGVWNGLRRLRPAVDEFRTFVQLRRFVTASALLVLAMVVHWQALTLISQPQQAEWRRFRAMAEGIDPVSPGRVFVISPQPGDSRTAVRHLDEFGSFSADADWAAKEMMIQAMRSAHPWTVAPFRHVSWDSGYVLPKAKEFYDHVVDLRPPK